MNYPSDKLGPALHAPSATAEVEAAAWPRVDGRGGNGYERTLERANRLVRLAHDLATSLESSRTTVLVAQGLADLLSGEFAATYVIGEEGSLRLAGVAGVPAADVPCSPPSLVVRALSERVAVCADSPELAELEARGVACAEAIAAPIATQSEPLGVLLVAAPVGAELDQDPALVQTVADLAASSLTNARRFALTFAEARLDALTGLANHRAFHEHLDAALRDALAQGGEVSLVLFDLDDFKRVNDCQGHPVGDRVLREVARVALRTLRGGEELFRVGGEEFAIVIEGGAEAGSRVAERLRSAVARERRGPDLPSLSAGVAVFPGDARTKDELLHKADLALYAAKRAGKNLVVGYAADVQGAAGRARSEVRREAVHERMRDEEIRAVVLSELEAVTDAVRALGREPTPRAMLQAACRHLTTVLGATGCLISRVDGEVLRSVVDHWPPPFDEPPDYDYLLADYPLTRDVLERDEALAISLSDADVDPSEAFVLRELGMQALLMVPLRVGGRPWGLVEIYDVRNRLFGPAETGLAQLVVGQAGALLTQFEHGESLQRLYRETLASLASALDAEDLGASRHAQEVAELAVEVGVQLGLDASELRALELGALLHDVGKLHLPASILSKPAPLEEREWKLVRAHPRVGAEILAPIGQLADVVPIVRSCHERWDGAGYPDGLAGDDIPLSARIVAVCDAFCAMHEPRPHRAPLGHAQVLGELRAGMAAQFDPRCVEALLEVLADHAREGSRNGLHRPASEG